MAEMSLEGDKSEKILLSIKEGELYFQFEMPETSLKKGPSRDNLQYYLSRSFKVQPEQQVLLMKFIELANLAYQIYQRPQQIGIIPQSLDIMSLIDQIPPQVLRQLAEKIKNKLNDLNENKDG